MTSIKDLKIRPMRVTDFKIYYRMVSNPQIARSAHFHPADNYKQGQRLFRDDLKNADSYAVIISGQMTGMISLYPTIGDDSAPNESVLELAYMILPAYQRRHYMTRALRQLINRLKRSSNVNKLVALVSENNVPSRKILKNNGFVTYHSVMDMNTNHTNLIYQLSLN